MTQQTAMDKRLNRIEDQLDSMARAIVIGFEDAAKNRDLIREDLGRPIDIYARAVDTFAKQAEIYMQKTTALTRKVNRLERQIKQIAEHLDLKLSK